MFIVFQVCFWPKSPPKKKIKFPLVFPFEPFKIVRVPELFFWFFGGFIQHLTVFAMRHVKKEEEDVIKEECS
jgi:hypothetical protein